MTWNNINIIIAIDSTKNGLNVFINQHVKGYLKKYFPSILES